MIEKSVWLASTREEAFQLFTDRISEWWPPGHRPSKDESSTVRLGPGGRFWETTAEGREFEMGRVTEWDPPRLVRLAFFLGTGPDHPTDVTIRFTEEAGGTRVTIAHGPGEVASALWESRAPRYSGSWEAVMAALVSR